jgi:hypothetical protein
MKIQYYFLTVVLLFSGIITAQVSLGSTAPDSSSLLDLYSTSKGLLIPRMTKAQRDSIPSPAKGLMIFNTDNNSVEINRGTPVIKIWTLLLNDVPNSSYNSVFETETITTVSPTDVVATGMTLTPVEGTYSVSFNSQFNNSKNALNTSSTPFSGTAQGVSDLQAAYDELMAIPTTNSSHIPAMGTGETLLSGVYSFVAAASIAGTLTLDAQGNHDALFIFKVGGAFAVAAATTIVLANGAEARNVFWVSEGPPSLGAACVFKGTIIAQAGAGAVAATNDFNGRMFTMYGALTFGPSIATVPLGISPINLRSLASFALFTSNGFVSNTADSSITGNIGTNIGEIIGFETAVVNGSVYTSSSQITSTTPIITTTYTENNNKVDASFSIYQNNILIPSSVKTLISTANASNISLQAIATVDGTQPIEVRWKTGTDKITMGNRILTVIKVQ